MKTTEQLPRNTAQDTTTPATGQSDPAPLRYESPLRQGRSRVLWSHVIVVFGIHALATLALLPWLFSWTSVVLNVVGIYVFGMFGIIIGFHRLLAHRSFQCPKWFEHLLALLGVCCLQGTPSRWVSTHRIHHQYSDDERDPHTPLVSFLWSHFEWLLTQDKQQNWLMTYDKYTPDLIRDRLYLRLERNASWMGVYALHAVAFFLTGFAIAALVPGGSLAAGLQLGASFIVWGVFLRTVLVWHITWSVNSLTHLAGYRNYKTSDQSRNNWFVAVIASGEGWHNNHHADPRSAAAGHHWWEFDLSYQIIRLFGLVGLATEIVPIRAHHDDQKVTQRPQLSVVAADGTPASSESPAAPESTETTPESLPATATNRAA